ncbi:SAM-dependent methyltransferase [Actinomadura viridis]|uniref:SAM-dependent methyltransferase n=1 Tax=Actinomadura viridis TaxID=58110 RepID=UPI003690229C
MSGTDQAPPGVDPHVPSAARLYDLYLGGKDNFAADRAAARRLREDLPELEDAAWANRGFLQRAVRYLATRGIRQFLDIGAGLPTQNNTHQVAGAVRTGTRVVYVDNDPTVLTHARALLQPPDADRPGGTGPRTTVLTGDLREPESILGDVIGRHALDLDEPVALLLVAVTHFIPDEENPWDLVRRLLKALAPGSHLVLSAATRDHQSPRALQAVEEVYSKATANVHLRTRDEIGRFFSGLEMIPPYPGAEAAVTYVGQWGAEDPEAADSDGSRWSYCGVARLP